MTSVKLWVSLLVAASLLLSSMVPYYSAVTPGEPSHAVKDLATTTGVLADDQQRQGQQQLLRMLNAWAASGSYVSQTTSAAGPHARDREVASLRLLSFPTLHARNVLLQI